jgi:hypothetical protein
MSKQQFKCVEGPEGAEHVAEHKITAQDALGALEFFEHFEIESDLDYKTIRKELSRRDITPIEIHDLIHNLLDVLVEAHDKGNKDVSDPMFDEIVKELRVKQQLCKNGVPKHGHEEG